MTETTTDGTDALACQVTLYRRETYLAVKFILKNVREEAVTVDYRQTVPDDLTDSHLSFTSNYMGDAWEFEDATLEFSTEIGGEEQIESVYGIKRVGMADLVDFIRYATIVVRQDGKTVETVTGIDPDVDGDRDAAEKEGTSSETGADETEAGEVADQSAVRADDASREVADATGQSDATGERPKAGGASDQPPSGVETGGITGDHGADRSVTDHDGSIEWETLTPEQERVDAGGEPGATTAAGSHVPFSETADETDTGTETRSDRTPALPANRSDYILEDVRGEIESSNEFEWVDLAGDPDEESDGGVLGWLRSRLPL